MKESKGFFLPKHGVLGWVLSPRRCTRIVSVIIAEGPPVPIPNTEVKLC